MKGGRWFLPDTPDVLGQLRRQLDVTIEGLDAFAQWAAGDSTAARAVRQATARGDSAKRELLTRLRAAFITPLEPEDVFALSRGIDRILYHACDLVGESEAMDCPPDAKLAEMALLLAQAMRRIEEAIARLGSGEEDAIVEADEAIKVERRLKGAYYDGMADLLSVTDRQERIARRELYRRCAGIGETVVDVAERVVYAVVKEN